MVKLIVFKENYRKNHSAMKFILTLTLNKIYFDINEEDKQQKIDNMILRYQLIYIVMSHGDHTKNNMTT